MDHQTLHVGNISQQREDLQGVDELPCFFLSAFDLEREDRAAAIGEVLLIERVTGVILQCGVIDLCHLRMIGEELHHLQRILDVTLYAQAQRLDTLQEDEGIEG